uniref:Uncharacterized protein n=1 Tax=Zea mays TaxID=4577 RepID=C4J5F9_MAIZE|nr:unknown [Zea mays]
MLIPRAALASTNENERTKRAPVVVVGSWRSDDSHVDGAVGRVRELEGDGGVDAGGDYPGRGAGGEDASAGGGAGAAAGGEQRGAVDEEVVAARDPAADLPLDAAVHPDVEQHVSRLDVLLHGVRHVLRHGDRVARHDRRPHRHVLVALVDRRHRHGYRHRLVAVRGERVQRLVVHAHPLVRVPRRDRHLEVEGERRVAEVDGAQLHVLQVEGRLGGAQRQVDDEHDEAYDDGQRQDAGGDGAAAAPEDPVAVVLLLAHGDQRAAAVVAPALDWEL